MAHGHLYWYHAAAKVAKHGINYKIQQYRKLKYQSIQTNKKENADQNNEITVVPVVANYWK